VGEEAVRNRISDLLRLFGDSKSKLMKILIVDHQALFREGLTGLLENQPEVTLVQQAGTIAQGLCLIPEINPDIILVDLDLPDGNGLEAVQKILECWPDANVAILSIHNSEEYALSAIRYGAIGFIPKDMPKEHFLATIRGIHHGEAAITRKMTRRLIQEYNRMSRIQAPNFDGKLKTLTFREYEVFELLSTGFSNREIAARLHIAENTVKSHVHNILEKLNLRSRSEARALAMHIR